jgi:outer membrane protein assembly factor BamB
VASNEKLNSSNVGSLKLRWMTNTGFAAFSTPVVVTSAKLKKQIVYAGSRDDFMSAYDAETGALIWRFQTGNNVVSTPAVADGVAWWGSNDHKLYALDADTGALKCSANLGGIINASPVIGDPGTGNNLVYVSDAGATGGPDHGHLWAIRASDCSVAWSYGAWGSPAGSSAGMRTAAYSPPAFGHLADGTAVVVEGTTDPDDSVYAFNARTGVRLWRFATPFHYPDADVGAGPTLSPPGANGFADGAVYVEGKDHMIFAIDLKTGAQIWRFNIDADTTVNIGDTQSTASLLGNTLYVGYGSGVYALNATTGAKVWRWQNPSTAATVSAPSIVGGSRVAVLFGDEMGVVWALKASTGTPLWNYTTGSLVWSSVAVSRDGAYVDSGDGFLYKFELPFTTPSAFPDVTITSPANGASVTNPGTPTLAVTGTATDDTGVHSVLVGVRRDQTDQWWDPSKSSWVKGFTQFSVPLSNPGATSTSWDTTFPITSVGGSYSVEADAIDLDGQRSAPVAFNEFTVTNSAGSPDTTITVPTDEEVFVLPNPIGPVTFSASGDASDQPGADAGVQTVKVVILNRENNEYYCGSAGCPPGSTTTVSPDWASGFRSVAASLGSPGALSTTWTLTVVTPPVASNFKLQAWAVDVTGNADPTKASARFCTKPATAKNCNG